MALFLTIVLILSCAALVSLLYAKEWEMRTGRILVSGMRPRLDHYSRLSLAFVERVVPDFVEEQAGRLVFWLRTSVRAALAHGLLQAEHALERILHALRHRTLPPPSAGGEASAFLREVADYKKKLMKRSRNKFPALKE